MNNNPLTLKLKAYEIEATGNFIFVLANDGYVYEINTNNINYYRRISRDPVMPYISQFHEKLQEQRTYRNIKIKTLFESHEQKITLEQYCRS